MNGTKQTRRFRLGMAGYTYARLSVDKTLASMKQADVHYLCVKDYHLPLNAKPAADGSTDMRRRRQSPELCAKISDLCAKYDLKFAIHNHSRNPKTGWPELFATPADVWNVLKDMDPRMGLCIDVAFTFADGLDPVEDIKRYSSRLFDLHFRNISNPKDGLSCTDSTTGVIDYYRIVKTLVEVGYEGVCGIELIHPFPKRPQWINTSVGYFRGLMDAVNRDAKERS